MLVSADVVVAPDDDTARELATGYGLWVLSIRNGHGAIDFPTPEEAAAHEWSDDERDLVADRIATQFVGSPQTVADQLQILADETGADELLITTITHDHADRVRSYELLARSGLTTAHTGDGLGLSDGAPRLAQAEVVAQRRTGVVGAEHAAFLQLGHDLVDEVVETVRREMRDRRCSRRRHRPARTR